MAKPIYDYEYEEEYCDDGIWDVVKKDYYLCGECREILLDYDWEYCPYCGEPIDWSDVRE